MSIDRQGQVETEIVHEETVLRSEDQKDERDIADRNRLIRKGKGVLDLCIKQNKLLCVQGFVDSQIERGGVYVDVVREMQTYIAAELTQEKGKQERRNLADLHGYISERLSELVSG